MPGSYVLDHNVRKIVLLPILFVLFYSFGTLSFAGSYATTKAIEYYNNGEYKRAKSVLSNIDISNDPTATYMMGAIALVDDEFGRTSKNLDNAINWFETSAKLNFPQAYQALGRAYEQRWIDKNNLDDFESSKSNYETAINQGIKLASTDLSRLMNRPAAGISEAEAQRLKQIKETTLLVNSTVDITEPVTIPVDENSQAPVIETNASSADEISNPDTSVDESTMSLPGLSVGAGMGIPYGVIGANIIYPVSESIDLTMGAGLGFGAGIRKRLSNDIDGLRLTFFYGTNAGFRHPVSDEFETFAGYNFGVGYGSRSGGWDFDLIYMIVSDDTKTRIEELETQGNVVTSGTTDDQFKISFGYHW